MGETVAKVAEERKDEAAADAVASVEKKLEEKLETTMEAIEAAAVPMEEIEVGPVGEFLIKWGFKDDPRMGEDERIPAMQRIKDSGKAGVIAYALTEGAFWIGSVPFAIAAVTLATGSFPDIGSDEGKAAIGADAFIFINFAAHCTRAHRLCFRPRAVGRREHREEVRRRREGGVGGGPKKTAADDHAVADHADAPRDGAANL